MRVPSNSALIFSFLFLSLSIYLFLSLSLFTFFSLSLIFILLSYSFFFALFLFLLVYVFLSFLSFLLLFTFFSFFIHFFMFFYFSFYFSFLFLLFLLFLPLFLSPSLKDFFIVALGTRELKGNYEQLGQHAMKHNGTRAPAATKFTKPTRASELQITREKKSCSTTGGQPIKDHPSPP